MSTKQLISAELELLTFFLETIKNAYSSTTTVILVLLDVSLDVQYYNTMFSMYANYLE